MEEEARARGFSPLCPDWQRALSRRYSASEGTARVRLARRRAAQLAADHLVEDIEIGADIRRRPNDHHFRQDLGLVVEDRMREVRASLLLEDFQRALVGQGALVFFHVGKDVFRVYAMSEPGERRIAVFGTLDDAIAIEIAEIPLRRQKALHVRSAGVLDSNGTAGA